MPSDCPKANITGIKASTTATLFTNCDTTIAILAVYYIINLGKEDVVPFPKLAAGINWDLIMMFATIAPLVAAVNAAESNIMPFVVEQLSGILDNRDTSGFTTNFSNARNVPIVTILNTI